MMATGGHVVTGALQYTNMKENINMEESLEIMNKKSGILGISGKSSDLRQVLEEMQNSDDRFRLAVYMVVYRIKKYISSCATALGGVDALCFTGKIGEKSSLIRKKACEDFEFIGVIIDNKKNEKTTIDISSKYSKARIFVIPTNEELVIAKNTYNLIKNTKTNIF